GCFCKENGRRDTHDIGRLSVRQFELDGHSFDWRHCICPCRVWREMRKTNKSSAFPFLQMRCCCQLTGGTCRCKTGSVTFPSGMGSSVPLMSAKYLFNSVNGCFC